QQMKETKAKKQALANSALFPQPKTNTKQKPKQKPKNSAPKLTGQDLKKQ
ncbi:MAG: hypothetical protein EZS28_039848, partial [Streblomastix strix]